MPSLSATFPLRLYLNRERGSCAHKFQDERVEFKDWPAFKLTTPAGTLPLLYLGDGSVLTQSSAILRFVGTKAGLYPTDALAAARVDEVLSTLEDFVTPIVASMKETLEVRQAKREAFVATGAPVVLGFLQKLLEKNGDYFVGSAPTIAGQSSECVTDISDATPMHSDPAALCI